MVVESYGVKLSVISEIFTQMLTEFEDIRANQILSVTRGKRIWNLNVGVINACA